MLSAATRSRLLSTHPWVPIAPRWSRPPERKNAHRGLARSCRAASRPTRSQASIASGENSRCCTKARRTPLLPQGDQSATGDDQLEQVVVNAPRTVVPNQNYGPADLTGIFPCGGFQCSYQMGQTRFPGLGLRGVWLSVNLHGKPGGQWAQTYIDSNTVQFSADCTSSCPFYTSEWSGSDYFIDTPARFADSSVTWVAQTSYLLPNQSGAAFTFQWGFILSNGAASYISPVVVAPWASQQQLIRGGQ
jgi:hypothetical protein